MRNMKVKDIRAVSNDRNKKREKCPECGKDIHDADCPYSGRS